MALLEAALRAKLLADAAIANLVGTRVSPWPLPQASPMPAITYFRVSGAEGVTQDGRERTTRARYQVDSWGGSYQAARELEILVRKALNGFKGTVSGVPIQGAFVEESADEFEDEGGQYRCPVDVTIWTEEA